MRYVYVSGRANAIYSYITFIVSLAFRGQNLTTYGPELVVPRDDADIITVVRTLLPRTVSDQHVTQYLHRYIPDPSGGGRLRVCDIFRAPPGLPVTQSYRRRRRRFIYLAGPSFGRRGRKRGSSFVRSHCPPPLVSFPFRYYYYYYYRPCASLVTLCSQGGRPSLGRSWTRRIPIIALAVCAHTPKKTGRWLGVRLRRTIRVACTSA